MDDSASNAIKPVATRCKLKAERLDELFRKALPESGASDIRRYIAAVRNLGKGSKVEQLMKDILVDVELLACERGMKTATEAQQNEILKAIEDISCVQSSVPEPDTGDISLINSSTGVQNAVYGNSEGNSRQYFAPGGTMNFGIHENERHACLKTLFLTDPKDDRDNLVITKGSRVQGTCEWVLKHRLYVEWLDSQYQLLWLSGAPGKGKTMISIFLAEELERISNRTDGTIFLQYFCDNTDEKRNSAIAILKGLIRQLLNQRAELFKHILPTFQGRERSSFAESPFITFWRIFEAMLLDPVLGTVNCVIDGLDECDSTSLELLLVKVKALFWELSEIRVVRHLKFILVSRRHPDVIQEQLRVFPHLRLDPDADVEVNDDISRFINFKIDQLSIIREYPDHLRKQLKHLFYDRAEGTFLWVGLAVENLRNIPRSEVEQAVKSLPKGLNELYARILLQIKKERREHVIEILLWVVLARRPLTVSELSAAVGTCASPRFTSEEIIKERLIDCGSFIAIKSDEVHLVHQSAKEYLLRGSPDSMDEAYTELDIFRIQTYSGDLEIARRCFYYLQSGSLEDGAIDMIDYCPLLSYFRG